jgi:diguanylate cyclase (GGDEF)-like protein
MGQSTMTRVSDQPVGPESRGFLAVGITVILAIVVMLLMSVYDEHRFSKNRIGINIAPSQQGILIHAVSADMPAEAAGVQANDILIRIEGRSIDDLQTVDEVIEQRTDPDAPIELTVLRDGQEVTLYLVPGVPIDVAGLLTQLILVGAYLGLGLLVAPYRNVDLRARLLMLFVTLVAIEMAVPAGFTFPVWYFHALILFWFMATGAQLALELHLVSLIPRRLRVLNKRPRLVWLYYLVGIGLGIGLCLVAIDIWFVRQDPTSTALATAQGAVLAGWAISVVAILLWQIRQAESPRGRNQALLILVGLAPWVVYVFLSQFWSGWEQLGLLWTQHLENLALLFFPAAVFVAIFRYGLFDIEHLVRRSLVYGIIAAFIVIFFYTLLTTALPWISQRIGDETALWLVTGVAIATGLLFRPLRSSIEQVVERGFFPERRALRQRLIQIASALSSEQHLKDLAQHLADETRQALGLTWVTVVAIDGPGRDLHTAFSEGINADQQKALVGLLDTESETFEQLSRNQRPLTVRRLTRHHPEAARELSLMGAEVLAPLYFQRRMIGILCLSSKRNGDLFQREEIELLDLFSHQIAASLENLRLFQDATYEGLTGLLRREAVLRQLDSELDRATSNNTDLSVFMIDLDRFKVLNDAHGHLFGDQVLEQVSRVMQKTVRAVDSLGRYGGEEFLLVLPDTDRNGAERVAEKLREAVQELEFLIPRSDATATITISIGITGAGPDQGYPPGGARVLIETADRALYKAKQQGRNQTVIEHWATEVV